VIGIYFPAAAQDPQFLPNIAPAPETPHPESGPSPAPETPMPEPGPPRPASFYASSGATANSALVHDQAASFWGTDPFESFANNPLQWGPFELRPFGIYRFTYGNGLNVSPGNPVTTALHEFTPGAVLQSRHLSFRYAPTLNFYSSDDFDDGVDHSASASANFGVDAWFFTLGYGFSKTSSILIETGGQTPRESHSTVLAAHYQYSEKTSFDFSLNQSIQEAESLNSSKSWSTMNWVNHHWTDKTLVGFGLGGGYTKQDFGSDMTHEQLQGRIGWHPGTKLSINLNGGLEFRQFGDSGIEEDLYPVFGASIFYTPWGYQRKPRRGPLDEEVVSTTTFSLTANHSVGASLLAAQATETSRISAGVRQRFLEVLHLDLFAGLTIQDYQNVAVQGQETSLETSRSDDILSFSATLGCGVFKKGDISIFYQHSQNESSAEGLSYDSDQIGLQVSYRY
jgi:hypothetical protein